MLCFQSFVSFCTQGQGGPLSHYAMHQWASIPLQGWTSHEAAPPPPERKGKGQEAQAVPSVCLLLEGFLVTDRIQRMREGNVFSLSTPVGGGGGGKEGLPWPGPDW